MKGALRGFSLLVLALGLAAGASACAPGRAIEARLLLRDLAATEEPDLMKSWTARPERVLVSYRVEERERAGELYLPAEGPAAGLVLVPGVAEEGKDDPRFVALASSLARARFSVLVPEMAGFRRLRVDPADAREVADALAHIAADPVLAPQGRVGVAAISYAVGPALLAALEPDVRATTKFIVGVGGFYDLEAVVTFFTTGYYRDEGGRWRYLRPNEYGKWVFVLSNAGRLEDAADRARFEAMARRKLDDPDAPIHDLEEGLGSEGQAFLALLKNGAPERVPELLAALPEAVRADLAALDPVRRDLEKLQARLILIHGRHDTIIPYTESLALGRAVTPGQAHVYIVEGLMHVDIEMGVTDRWSLWRAAYRLLEERDGVARATSAGAASAPQDSTKRPAGRFPPSVQ